ncbi:MAG: MBOAT family O-acyltransferase [Bacteroidota bacterium]|nr:MBOAT family O-acyltransferase [Bacteroidota bacterium]
MLFNSLHFLIFLPIVVGLYYLLPTKLRWVLIFIASCYFYMAFVPEYIFILFLIIIVDFVAALTIEQVKGRLKLFYLVISIIANIGLLAYFKYINFINVNLTELFSFFGIHFYNKNINYALPIGLSFHTFQSLSYTIEVYRGNQKAERHLGYFANYVLFFPQMVAGPIERYATLGSELKKQTKPLYENFSNGFRLILFGLFIKMAVADNIAPVVNQVYENPLNFNSLRILNSIFLFSIQIYADFFGYSTIALGCARLLGINIMDNFKTPYLSKSITEFWRRWHISLSTWFRDYLYISLGGNKVKVPRWCLNILIVFTVSGLWHGASWTFVIWGALHGLMILLERLFSKLFNFKIKEGWNIVNVLLAVKTFIVSSFIWIFFRAENFEKVTLIFKALATNNKAVKTDINYLLPCIFTLILILTDVLLYNNRFDKKIEPLKITYRWAIYSLLLFSLLALSGMQKFTFIYFQF